MTKAQKDTLRDLFEGCFTFELAYQMAQIDDVTAARKLWDRWQKEFDESF